MSYLIVYDIREVDNATRLRVGELHKLAGSIESAGGKAIVLKKKLVK